MPVRPFLLALLVSVCVGSARAQNPRLQRLIERGRHPAMRWGLFPDVQGAALRLYRDNGWRPLWLARGRPTSAARALLDALTTAGDRGLHPEDYDAAQLAALAATLERGGADAEQAARFDAALSIDALRLVLALARGRLPPHDPQLGVSSAPFDPATTVAQLRGTTEPSPILASLEPQWADYQALRHALVRYRALLRDSARLRLPNPGPREIREGQPYSGAPQLRQLLDALGDLDPREGAARGNDSLFSTELADGLRRFEAREGARGAGIMNEATWRSLTTQLPRRIHQMELALERWRWLPRDLGATGPPLFVSLPAMRLHYQLETNGEELQVMSMSVRVESELLREREALAGVLARLEFRAANRTLGTVWFPLESDSRLYLNGSIPADPGDGTGGGLRVADGELLAALLLRDRPDWSLARIHAAMGSLRPVHVRLRRSVPVLIVYGTAVARENGQVFFSEDGYGHDRRLEQRLARGYPYSSDQ